MADPIAYTMIEAARASGIGRTRLYELVGAGHLAARKCGTRTLILAESLREYVASLPSANIRAVQQKAGASSGTTRASFPVKAI